MSSRFDRDTACTPLGDGRFGVRIDRGWWVVAGANGGYVAALVLRALQAAVDDPARVPRSLTVHYLRPPQEGAAEIETRIERSGRALTSVSGRLVQEGRPLCLALGAFALPYDTPSFDDLRMPEVEPPDRCAPLEARIEINRRYDIRWAAGALPFSGGEEALAGGWIRPGEPRPLDAPLVAAYTDAFPPAVFSRALDRRPTGGVPTIDLSIHFRATLPRPGAAEDAFCLALFRSRLAREGFLEEDGEIWSPDGVLLAQSRQLALLR